MTSRDMWGIGTFDYPARSRAVVVYQPELEAVYRMCRDRMEPFGLAQADAGSWASGMAAHRTMMPGLVIHVEDGAMQYIHTSRTRLAPVTPQTVTANWLDLAAGSRCLLALLPPEAPTDFRPDSTLAQPDIYAPLAAIGRIWAALVPTRLMGLPGTALSSRALEAQP